MLEITREAINQLENLKEDFKIFILYSKAEQLAERIKLELLIHKPTLEIKTLEYHNIEENCVYVTFTKKEFRVDMPYNVEFTDEGIQHCLKLNWRILSNISKEK